MILNDRIEAAKRRRILNDKNNDENRILIYLKKNKCPENDYIDEKIKDVADTLKAKQNFIFDLMKILNFESLISMLNFLIQKKQQENLKQFILKRARKTINRNFYAIYVYINI